MHGQLHFTDCGWFKELGGIHVINVGWRGHVTWDSNTQTAIILHNHNRWLLLVGLPRLCSSLIVTLPIGAPAGISNRHVNFVMMNTLNTAYYKICSQIWGKNSWCASSTWDHLHTCSRLMTTRLHSSQQENGKFTHFNSIKTGGICSKLSITPWR